MSGKALLAGALTALALLAPVPGAQAGDCTGFVVGVQPITRYNPSTGSGFLAVRTGPGTQYRQIGELYAGDEVAVWDRRGNWYHVRCMAGRCMSPLRGEPMPTGWSHGRYLSVGGVCP